MDSSQTLQAQYVEPGTIISLEFGTPIQYHKSKIIRYDEANRLIFLTEIKELMKGQLVHVKLRYKTRCIIFSSPVAQSADEVAIEIPIICTVMPRHLFERTRCQDSLEINGNTGDFIDISLGGFCADMHSLDGIQAGQWFELKTGIFSGQVLINDISGEMARGQFSILSAMSSKLIDVVRKYQRKFSTRKSKSSRSLNSFAYGSGFDRLRAIS